MSDLNIPVLIDREKSVTPHSLSPSLPGRAQNFWMVNIFFEVIISLMDFHLISITSFYVPLPPFLEVSMFLSPE